MASTVPTASPPSSGSTCLAGAALATAKKASIDTGRGYAEVYLNLSKQFAMLTESPVTAWSGGVYDCWTDVETECDGFLSYDRVLKVPVAPMRAANALLTGDDDA